MEEQRREQHRRDDVGPVKVPVKTIEPAEREREGAEKREAQPEEMEGGRIVGPPQPHGTADEQREDADARENEVKRRIAAGRGRELHRQQLMLPEAEHRVRQSLGVSRLVQGALHIVERFDRRAIDGDQKVAAADPGGHRGAARGNIGGHHAFRPRLPQDTVLELVPGRAHSDIQCAETQQHADKGEEAPAA